MVHQRHFGGQVRATCSQDSCLDAWNDPKAANGGRFRLPAAGLTFATSTSKLSAKPTRTYCDRHLAILTFGDN